MKFKAIPTAIVSLALLGGAFAGFAAAGSADDPLISLSFAAGEYSESVLSQASALIDSQLSPSAGSELRVVDMAEGGELRLGFGGSVTLLSGSADISIESGEVINITDGTVAGSGALEAGKRYLAAESTIALVSFTAPSQAAVEGAAEIVSGELGSPFDDVNPGDWFCGDVLSAVDMDLIDGMTATRFEPDGSMTNAQVIKLAACAHQLYHDGDVTLENGSPWYAPYVEYALENGIITTEPDDYDAASSRAYYIAVMYNALPEDEYGEINDIPEGAVPDVPESAWYHDKVYAFYRAGIVTGSDGEGSFMPGSDVKRSEVATLAARMFDEDARRSFELG